MRDGEKVRMGLPVPWGVSGSGREKQFTQTMVPEGCLQESRLLKKMAWLILCVTKRVSFRLDTRRVCKLIVPLRAHFSLEKLNCC